MTEKRAFGCRRSCIRVVAGRGKAGDGLGTEHSPRADSRRFLSRLGGPLGACAAGTALPRPVNRHSARGRCRGGGVTRAFRHSASRKVCRTTHRRHESPEVAYRPVGPPRRIPSHWRYRSIERLSPTTYEQSFPLRWSCTTVPRDKPLPVFRIGLWLEPGP